MKTIAFLRKSLRENNTNSKYNHGKQFEKSEISYSFELLLSLLARFESLSYIFYVYNTFGRSEEAVRKKKRKGEFESHVHCWVIIIFLASSTSFKLLWLCCHRLQSQHHLVFNFLLNRLSQ